MYQVEAVIFVKYTEVSELCTSDFLLMVVAVSSGTFFQNLYKNYFEPTNNNILPVSIALHSIIKFCAHTHHRIWVFYFIRMMFVYGYSMTNQILMG